LLFLSRHGPAESWHFKAESYWDLRGQFEGYTGRVDVRGKRFLEIGAASGFVSFEAEKRGAEAGA